MLNTIAACIRNETRKTQLAALQTVALAAKDPHDGGIAVMDAIHHLGTIADEPFRFHTIGGNALFHNLEHNCIHYFVRAIELSE